MVRLLRSYAARADKGEKKMVKRMIFLAVLCCLLWLSGCATDYSSRDSYEYTPMYPYSQREVCGWGAVYCGPGP